jgi:CheY-like chemotaxis protein
VSAGSKPLHALVIDENKSQRDTVAAHLQAAQYRVDSAGHAAAGACIERGLPDVVVIGWGQGAGDVVRRIRSCEADKRSYIVALIGQVPGATIPGIIQAGVDDLMRTPIVREELLVRVEAPQRLAKWAPMLLQPSTGDFADDRDLRQLKAFKNMGAIVGEDLGQVLGPVTVTDGWQMTGEMRGARIPMSIASEEAEIRVSVVVEAKLLKTLAALLLGDENAPDAALEDMLREIANTAGGAVKRAAALEQVEITTGLPVNEGGEVTKNEMTRTWTAVIDGSKAQVGIIGEICKRANQRVPLSRAMEGMVITHDLRNDSGALLMPAGTRLTATAVARMVARLGPRFVVDVTVP